MHLAEPNYEIINYMRELKSKGIKIIIITGRRKDTQGDYTLRQLNEWNVPYDEIYFRRKNDFRPDSIFKASIIKWLLKRGYKIIEVWDDSLNVIEKLRKLIPNTKLIHYNIQTK